MKNNTGGLLGQIFTQWNKHVGHSSKLYDRIAKVELIERTKHISANQDLRKRPWSRSHCCVNSASASLLLSELSLLACCCLNCLN